MSCNYCNWRDDPDDVDALREKVAALEAEAAALRQELEKSWGLERALGAKLVDAYKLREIAAAEARRMALEEAALRAIATRPVRGDD